MEQPRIELRILGPLEAQARERVLQLGGPKQRAVLAYLLLHAGAVVSVDRLIDDLWGGRPPKTARTAIAVYVSRLRRILRAGGKGPRIVTRRPGYELQLRGADLDLARFERLAEQAERARERGEAAEASAFLVEALSLWRGSALADFTYEPFAQAAIARLEELRALVLERRIEADLALGREAELVPELEQHVRDEPQREALRGQLMLALYRLGRQAEALDVFADARRALVDGLGIEPSRALQELHTAILRQDPGLDSAAASVPARLGTVLVAASARQGLDALLPLAVILVRDPRRELVAVRLLEDEGALAEESRRLEARRRELASGGLSARAAAFTSGQPGRDTLRLVSEQDVELLLVPAPPGLLEGGRLRGELRTVLDGAPCDVGILVASKAGARLPDADRPVVVPFGGAEHDWAALELAAWAARGAGAPLRLLGVRGGPRSRRDSSRLLATASLAVQQLAGVAAEPVLAERGAEQLTRAAGGAGLLVLGLASAWRRKGVGAERASLARRVGAPTILVRYGPRPGGLAPRESLTRFSWSLGPAPDPS